MALGAKDWKFRQTSRRPITGDLVRRGVFIFIGRIQASTAIDYDLIMDYCDRLLSLYKFVEGEGEYPAIIATKPSFQFRSGCTVKQSSAESSTAERQLNVKLRHNELQLALHNHLCGIYGADEVGAEIGCVDGSIDVVLRRGTKYTFYEIKTAMSARGCIRQVYAALSEMKVTEKLGSMKPTATVSENRFVTSWDFTKIENPATVANRVSDHAVASVANSPADLM